MILALPRLRKQFNSYATVMGTPFLYGADLMAEATIHTQQPLQKFQKFKGNTSMVKTILGANYLNSEFYNIAFLEKVINFLKSFLKYLLTVASLTLKKTVFKTLSKQKHIYYHSRKNVEKKYIMTCNT